MMESLEAVQDRGWTSAYIAYPKDPLSTASLEAKEIKVLKNVVSWVCPVMHNT